MASIAAWLLVVHTSRSGLGLTLNVETTYILYSLPPPHVRRCRVSPQTLNHYGGIKTHISNLFLPKLLIEVGSTNAKGLG